MNKTPLNANAYRRGYVTPDFQILALASNSETIATSAGYRINDAEVDSWGEL